MILVGRPAHDDAVEKLGNFIARRVERTPRGDGQLWFRDWDRCSLEAYGEWDEVKRAVLLAGRPPVDAPEG